MKLTGFSNYSATAAPALMNVMAAAMTIMSFSAISSCKSYHYLIYLCIYQIMIFTMSQPGSRDGSWSKLCAP